MSKQVKAELNSYETEGLSASEALQKVYSSLDDYDITSLHDWDIELASNVRDHLIGLINEVDPEYDSIEYEKAVIALYDLLNYSEDDFVVYNEDGIDELDFDTLSDALDD